VFSRSVAPAGDTVGVWGQVSSPGGWGGVFKGGRWGVWGEADGPGRWAGYFIGNGYFSGSLGVGTAAPAYPLHVATGLDVGIYGTSTSSGGSLALPVAGVKGVISSAAATGAGVVGVDTATTGGLGAGVAGASYSPDGAGVFAEN